MTKTQIYERIFCNRALNMAKIQAIGFDMDYTLALYKPWTFEALAYGETLKKLVERGYPQVILQWTFDHTRMIRGLVIDKNKGNILKMDRHRYVKVAYHGAKELTRDERVKLYDAARTSRYEEPEFALIDTLFTLADAYLFSQLVDLKDSGVPELASLPYERIYKDVRYCIDLCHRDGSIKQRVAADPQEYIEKDPHLLSTLRGLKKSGKKLFLLTNSLWEYTNAVMTFLCSDSPQKPYDWMQHFHLIITGAQKPAFFTSGNLIFEVQKETGLLRNVEPPLELGIVYQGGNVQQLHQVLGIETGSQLLYVGDHIYGDIVRSKKDLGWRTMLVVEELEQELKKTLEHRSVLQRFEVLRHEKDALDDDLQWLQNHSHVKVTKDNLTQTDIEKRTKKIRREMRDILKNYHQIFHPVWGEVMKTGYQNSRFAAQVEAYACLYTSRVSNLRLCAMSHSFSGSRDTMPHDVSDGRDDTNPENASVHR